LFYVATITLAQIFASITNISKQFQFFQLSREIVDRTRNAIDNRKLREITRDIMIWSRTMEKQHKGENPFKFFFLLDCHKNFSKERL